MKAEEQDSGSTVIKVQQRCQDLLQGGISHLRFKTALFLDGGGKFYTGRLDDQMCEDRRWMSRWTDTQVHRWMGR